MSETIDFWDRLRDAEACARTIEQTLYGVQSRLRYALGETGAVVALSDAADDAADLVKQLGEIRDAWTSKSIADSSASIGRSLRMGLAIALADDPKAAAVLVAKVEGYPLPDEAQETAP